MSLEWIARNVPALLSKETQQQMMTDGQQRAMLALNTRQTSLAGTAPDIGELLRIKSAAPIKPAKPQKACDIGLFSDDAAQTDLVQQAAQVAAWMFQKGTA